MATIFLRDGHDEEKDVDYVDIRFDNGDRQAIDDIVKKWKFKDRVSALRFALVVLKLSGPERLCKLEKNGEPDVIVPNSDLLAP